MQHPDISLSSHNGSKTRLGWSAVLEKIRCPDYFNGGISQKKKKSEFLGSLENSEDLKTRGLSFHHNRNRIELRVLYPL